ncbi:centromere-binding protein 1-like [Vigna angularis]|uniref:centromere-binding protein 1-like n=1 Tax=Phaseolus angularis TaxID=3914 RepID=UPI00080A59B2|nr:centromere-binding protein 1-like [Vigna angularis]
MVEGEVVGHGEVKREMGYGEGEDQGHDVQDAKVHDVQDDEVHDVEEAEVHEVHDFELEDLGEDDDVDESEDEDVHEAEDVDVDDAKEVDEDVDEDVECEYVSEESLVNVSIQCGIETSKGNVRAKPSTLVDECSRTTDNDSIDDVRDLSDIEWLSKELNSGTDSEDNDDSIKINFPTFSMPKSLGDYKWEVGTYFAEKKNSQMNKDLFTE